MNILINAASAIAELDRIGLGQFGFRDRYAHERLNESRVKSQLKRSYIEKLMVKKGDPRLFTILEMCKEASIVFRVKISDIHLQTYTGG